MSEFLHNRKATEEEVQEYFDMKAAVYREAARNYPIAKERFSYVLKRMREIPLIYQADLNWIIYVPPIKDVFQHWCRTNNIPHSTIQHVEKGWYAAMRFCHSSHHSPELKAEIEEAKDRRRKMRNTEIKREREEFFAKYMGKRHET